MRREVEVYARRADVPATGRDGTLPRESGQAARADGDQQPGRWTAGSGLLLGGRLVLTAAHVVCPDDPPSDDIRVRTADGEVTARVVWWRCDEETRAVLAGRAPAGSVGSVDVALLVITEPGWEPPRWRFGVRWGRLVTDRARQPCEAVGFPAVVATPQRRDSHPAVGELHPRALVKAALIGMEVTNPPAPAGPDGSRWAGMCGAALYCGDLVVGVVTVDPAGFDSRRLVATPMTAVTGDAEFAAAVAEHGEVSGAVEPVELAAIAEPVPEPRSPAGLLRADAAETPFRPRPELDTLTDWCRDPMSWSSVRLLVGAGGQGKTRLARRLAAVIASEGWATLIVAEHADANDVRVLAEVQVPTLVVIDYAESRGPQLAALLDMAARAQATVRLLLLARTAGAWRADHVGTGPHTAVLAEDSIVVDLSALEPTPTGRADAWRQAAISLAGPLGCLDGHRTIDWHQVAADLEPPDLADDRYATILAVQTDALAALLDAGHGATSRPVDAGCPGGEPTDAADRRIGPRGAARRSWGPQVLLKHERDYWTRVADRFGIELTPDRRRWLIVAATLWTAPRRDDADRLLAAALPGLDDDRRDQIAGWVAGLYPGADRYWAGLTPDPLAEYLIGTELGPHGTCTRLITQTVAALSVTQMTHGLTVLGRAHPRHPHLTDTITTTIQATPAGGAAAIAVAPRLAHPQPLLTALDTVITNADLDTLNALNQALPRFSLLLAPTTVTLAEATTAHHRHNLDLDNIHTVAALASSTSDLAVRLSEAGRRDEALNTAEEAVRLYRELITHNRDAHLPNLASSVNNLAVDLAEAGRRDEALDTAEEAVRLRRELVAHNRDAHLPDLAMSVNNLAVHLAEAGRRDKALNTAEEAVRLRRELVAHNRDAHLPDLAMSVNNLANRLAEAGRRDKALNTAEEAVRLYRELITHNRDAHLPNLAGSVNNLAVDLAEAGRRDEALDTAEEAVRLYRELVAHNRDAFLSNLAGSVNNLAVHLAEAGRRDEALNTAEEALSMLEELAERYPAAFRTLAAECRALVAALKYGLEDQ